MRRARHRIWQVSVLLMAALTLSSCGWRGISNLALPFGPGTGADSYTVYVQMPDTLALNNNSKVMVADVFVGTVHEITLKNWVATLRMGVDDHVKLSKNATAKIGQTSLLGSQHVELAEPENPSQQLLADGDTIPLERSSTYPNVEQTLASLAMILRGGGIPNLEVIQNELYNMINGRAPQIRDLLGKLDTFTARLNEQRGDITHAIDSTNRLLTTVAGQSEVLDRVLTEAPPLIKHLADPQYLRNFIAANDALGQLSAVTDQYLAPQKGNLHHELQRLQCPLKELSKSGAYLPEDLKFILSIVPVDSTPKVVRGDYLNVSLVADLTYSAVDNGLFTGTGFTGVLRSLEQSFGRDPENMVPDVRYTPNPNDAPGGPYVERGDRNC